jgi:transcriptional regulator with XRE-family HTH domain
VPFRSFPEYSAGVRPCQAHACVLWSAVMTLQELRKARGWTQAQLAERVGASRRAVQDWEAGVVPSPLYRRALANVLGLTLAELPFVPSRAV